MGFLNSMQFIHNARVGIKIISLVLTYLAPQLESQLYSLEFYCRQKLDSRDINCKQILQFSPRSKIELSIKIVAKPTIQIDVVQ
jgi:hypothetical protein